ncbi:lipoprotein [Nocardioides sp. BP30]|uniref:lipoprotein n=1 Tax=Nocardioides sp. BP30 TaxID=3036374 RepID=UPI002469506A|nr:lipoprotein [Nocardioides sp. BP30]WGL53000.1 lipoprotein [Nocardioides sp. BP30]
MKQILFAAVATLALAGCGSSHDGTASAGDASPSAGQSSQSSQSSQPGAGLSTSASSLGTVVVDTSGRTVYVYDADTRGATSSACTGGCASVWPEVPAGAVAAGVSGKVGSITGVDGRPQATLDGWPLYYYAHDTAAGDTSGQGVGGVWWVVSPDGDRISGGPSPTAGDDDGDDDGTGGSGPSAVASGGANAGQGGMGGY